MSRKAKIYKIDNNSKASNNAMVQFIVGIFVYALVIWIAANLFRGLFVANFFYAIIAALILSVLNYYLKPLLQFLTLPLNIITLGISYPIINVILLWLCDLIMGKSFELGGFLSAFIIAIFISILRLFLDSVITKNV
jgi:putative membrane protein